MSEANVFRSVLHIQNAAKLTKTGRETKIMIRAYLLCSFAFDYVAPREIVESLTVGKSSASSPRKEIVRNKETEWGDEK